MRRYGITGRRVALSVLFVALFLSGLYAGLPQVAGLDDTWGRLGDGEPWWLGTAVLLEVCSYAGYMVLFHGIFAARSPRIGWRESYLVAMAGVAATRVLATAGAGGIALTAWALSRSGMDRRALTSGMTAFFVLLYGIYMLALVLVGTGLRAGVLPGAAPFGLTVVPAVFGGCVIAVALATALLPGDLDRRVRERPARRERLTRWAAMAAAGAAAVADGVRGALLMLRHGNLALLGGLAWWAFDVAVLWACFHAFGDPPPVAVVVMGYFTGMLGNALPLPGGLGGVEGGMIAAFLAFDVAAGLAVVAVLSYRAFAFWLPTIPGLLAYLQLRRIAAEWAGASPAAQSDLG